MGNKDEFKDLAELNMFSAESSAPGYDDMYDEEYAAEITGDQRTPRSIVRMREEQPSHSREAHADASYAGVWGAVAILTAIASWVVWPTVLGPAAAITGFVAVRKGRRSLGGWAIVLGTLSFVFFLIAAY